MRRAVLPYLEWAFRVSGVLFAALVALSGFAGGLVDAALGRGALLLLSTLLLALATASSGLLLWDEWRRHRVEDSEYGEWTNKPRRESLPFLYPYSPECVEGEFSEVVGSG